MVDIQPAASINTLHCTEPTSGPRLAAFSITEYQQLKSLAIVL
jgi:hypothetical protein